MSNSMGVRIVVSSLVVVETLLKLAGIGSRKEEDASSTVVKVGSVAVKVGVVSCVMSCVFVVIVSSTDVVETLSKCARIGLGPEEVGCSTFVESVDVMVGVVSSSTSRVSVVKVLLLSRRGIVAGLLIGSGPEEVGCSTFVESVDVMVGVVSSSTSRVLVVKVLLLSRRGTVAGVLIGLAIKFACFIRFLLLLLLR